VEIKALLKLAANLQDKLDIRMTKNSNSEYFEWKNEEKCDLFQHLLLLRKRGTIRESWLCFQNSCMDTPITIMWYCHVFCFLIV